jgi:hypothetical protein
MWHKKVENEKKNERHQQKCEKNIPQNKTKQNKIE